MEITFAVGFLEEKRFRTVFKEEFGVALSEFLHGSAGEAKAETGEGWNGLCRSVDGASKEGARWR